MSSKKLTGNKRIIQDCCVDLYNNVQKWRRVVKDMHSTILQISKIKTEESLLNEEKPFSSNVEKLNPWIKILFQQLKDLELIVNKMHRISSKLSALDKLSESQLSNDSSFIDVDDILFQTWSLSDFCAVSEEIENMFRKELEAKTCICQQFGTLENSSLCLYEMCFKYEVNIDKGKLNQILSRTIFEVELQDQLQ